VTGSGRGGKLRLVAAVAEHGCAYELSTHVALSARHGHVGASERELGGRVVIELSAQPLCSRMASNARRRESGGRVIGIRGLLEISQMAAHAIHGRAGELPTYVAQSASHGHVSTS